MESWLYTNFLILVYAAPAMLAVYHILLFKRDAQSALGWILVCVFIPYLGPLVYFLFGINRVRTRAQKLDRNLFVVPVESGERETKELLAGETDAEQRLRQVGHKVCGHVLIHGNYVDAYYNGEQAYPEMLAAIATAKDSVLLSTYIFKDDKTGFVFIDALAAAKQRGVDVKVLLDGIGEYYSFHKASTLLERSAVPTARFLPPRFLPPSIFVNLRNHRKLLLVDNEVAFAGGMNIGDNHTSVDGKERSVSDMHFKFVGAIVDEMVQLFYHDWNFTTGEKSLPSRRSNVPAAGEMQCRMVPDGPSEQLDALALTIQTVISAATKSVRIMTPYFLPNREMIAALQSAALRGIDVTIVLPSKNNISIVHWANRNMLYELLGSGIKVFYQPGPFNHSKLLCIDDGYSLIGSYNLDPRSLRLNFELGIEIFSPQFNAELSEHFVRTVAISDSLLLAELANRRVITRLRDSIAALFAPYL